MPCHIEDPHPLHSSPLLSALTPLPLCLLVPGLASATWFLVPAAWFLVPGSWLLVSLI
jgi:hypothetical protein